jgi:hypothetical protein
MSTTRRTTTPSRLPLTFAKVEEFASVWLRFAPTDGQDRWNLASAKVTVDGTVDDHGGADSIEFEALPEKRTNLWLGQVVRTLRSPTPDLPRLRLIRPAGPPPADAARSTSRRRRRLTTTREPPSGRRNADYRRA